MTVSISLLFLLFFNQKNYVSWYQKPRTLVDPLISKLVELEKADKCESGSMHKKYTYIKMYTR